MTQPTLWKCEGGYPVGHPSDSNPGLCKVHFDDSLPLLRSTDGGQTWHQVGAWQQVGQFKQWQIQWKDGE